MRWVLGWGQGGVMGWGGAARQQVASALLGGKC